MSQNGPTPQDDVRPLVTESGRPDLNRGPDRERRDHCESSRPGTSEPGLMSLASQHSRG
jgi:hypothetical protein